MKVQKTIFEGIMCALIICTFNLKAQYDSGTVIYSEINSANLTSVLKNYIIVDFDGDSYSDVIMVKGNSQNNTNQLTWYKGDGSGNFASQANLLSVENAHKENEIFYKDMNGDGINDIIYQNNNTSFTVLFNGGQGNISAQLSNEITIDNPFETDLKELADVDGDGDMDGIFWNKLSQYYSYEYQGHCLIGYNNGNGNFSNYNYLDNNKHEMFLIIETVDIDNDGDLDIVSSGQQKVLAFLGPPFYVYPFIRLYENIGSNNFTIKEIELPSQNILSSNIKIQDINGDGTKEMLVEFEFSEFCGGIHPSICSSSPQFHIFDYDIQNKEFLILETYNSWLHNYTTELSLYGSPELYDNAFQIQFSDQNTDNNLDILSINLLQGRLQWHLGDGNGNFNNTQLVNFNNQYSSIRPVLRVADIDNDTDLDIFVLLNDDNSSNLTVLKNLALTPSCGTVLNLSNANLTDGIYQAGITLISSGDVVSGNNDVVLKAGNRVKLESGFKTPLSSSLKVRISSCN